MVTCTSLLAQDQLIELPPPNGGLTFPTPGDAPPIEVLARGPIHEAFATATGLEPKLEPVVLRKPPVDIRETPPELTAADAEQRPYVWIPGYWSWDEERDDFIWVSGAWRVEPEGRKWMPGYWVEQPDGWQRVSGFWQVAQAESFNYTQRPPQSLELGPTTPAPSENHIWTPGVWVEDEQYTTGYATDLFQWQPGCWREYREDYVWVPDHYVATPSGCVFVSGYWDYVLPARGELYAPIYCCLSYTSPSPRDRG